MSVTTSWMDEVDAIASVVGQKAVVVGIDVGKEGAFAILGQHSGECLGVLPTPLYADKKMPSYGDIEHFAAWLRTAAAVVGIEKIHAQSGDGPVGAFTFGLHEAAIRSMLHRTKARVYDVDPQRWQAKMLAGHPTGGRKGKTSSLLVASRLFPHAAVDFTRIAEAGKSDALLIAEYVRGWHNRHGTKA